MKKIIAALSLVALVGAGCANTSKTPATETKTSAESGQNVTTDKNGVSTLKTESGTTLQFETIPTKPSQAAKDVSVTDIFLGEAQEKLSLEVGSGFFRPNTFTVKVGSAVELKFQDVLGEHTFNIDETGTHVKAMKGQFVNFIAPKKPGSYKFYCDIANHRAAGMEGTLIVK